MFTEDFIRYHLPQERGWAYVHSWQIDQGHRLQWTDDRNPLVGWWDGIRKKFRSIDTEER